MSRSPSPTSSAPRPSSSSPVQDFFSWLGDWGTPPRTPTPPAPVAPVHYRSNSIAIPLQGRPQDRTPDPPTYIHPPHARFYYTNHLDRYVSVLADHDPAYPGSYDSPHSCVRPVACTLAHLNDHSCDVCQLQHLHDHVCPPCREEHLTFKDRKDAQSFRSIFTTLGDGEYLQVRGSGAQAYLVDRSGRGYSWHQQN